MSMNIIAELSGLPEPGALDTQWLAAQGVWPRAAAKTWNGIPAPLRKADIVRLDRDRFEFANHAKGEPSEPALVMVAFDRWGEPEDIVAWTRYACATWRGHSALLGAEYIGAFKIGPDVRVYRSILGWLRADRAGIVILDRKRAPDETRGLRMVAEDGQHARELERICALPRPIVRAGMPLQSRTTALAQEGVAS